MSDDLKGTVFNDRYTILERIGAGGMATVYRARDEQSASFVAIKILSREFLDRNPKEAERNLRRFKREADILALLNGSRHVVDFVEHACSEAGDWFIAMELLEGEQLSRSIGRGKEAMPIHTFLHHGRHLVQGLKEIHAKKIVHRDLAPDNVIVIKDADGLPFPKFLDFGIGKSLDNELDQVTQMLTIMGKPQYFSPEQARGVELTSASDVYSLGVVLYQLVTGHVPLEIRGIPDFKKIQKEPPIPIDSYREGQRIPSELQEVITRCLAKSPEDRPLLDEVLSVIENVRERANAGEEFLPVSDAASPSSEYTAPVQRVTTELELYEGAKVNRYEISRLLGRGGMGAVYEAWDPQLQRKVALKVASQIEEQEARNRLLKEARASAALRCENIVTIYDVGTDGGTPFIAMEFVDGKTLAQIIEEDGALSGQRFWEIASGLCEGLQLAHDRKEPVIHRDMKPANVLVHRHIAKITDFGIAKVSTGAEGGSGSDTGGHDVGGGTAATMSPEQINEEPVDHRSDLYSLGCVLYMMATGRGPYRGNQIAIIYQHCNAEPTPPSKIVPGTPAELDRIILKLLEKSPDERYASAVEVLEDLRSVFAPSEIIARPWYKSPLPIAACIAIFAAIVTLVVTLSADPAPASEASFGLNFVGAEGFTEGKTYYTNGSGLKIVGAGPEDGVLQISVARDGEEPSEVEPITFSGTFDHELDLGVADGQAGKLTISVTLPGTQLEPMSFVVVRDPSDPVVSLITSDGTPRKLNNAEPIELLHGDDPILEIVDEESGWGDPAAPKKRWRSDEETIEGIALSSDGNSVTVDIRTLAGGGKGTSYPIVRKMPRLEAPVARPWTASDSFELSAVVSCPPFDLAKHPLTDGDLVAVLGEQRVPLKHVDGAYRGRIAMPQGNGARKARTHEVKLTFRGKDTGDRFSLIHDPVPPAIAMTYTPAKGEAQSFTAEAPPKAALKKLASESMGTLFTLKATDDDILEDTAEVVFGGERHERPISDGAIVLPNDLPDLDEFDVSVTVKDRCGNRTTLPFRVLRVGTSVSSITADGVRPAGGVIWVQDPDDLALRIAAKGLAPGDRLQVAVLDEAGQVVGSPAPLAEEGGVFVANDVDLGGVSGSQRRTLRVIQSLANGGTADIADYPVAVDAADPSFEVAVHGQVVTLPARVRTAVFPTLTIRARDRSGVLDAKKADLIVEGPDHDVKLTPTDDGADWTVSAPEGAIGTWKLTFGTRDHSGRESPPLAIEIEVVRPTVFVAKAHMTEGAGKEADQFRGRPAIPLKDDSLIIRIGKSTQEGTVHLRAFLLPQNTEVELEQGVLTDGEVRQFRVRGLSGDEGRIKLAWYERVATDAVSADVSFDEIAWKRDAIPPTWEVLYHGAPVQKTAEQLATEGLKVTRLDGVALRLKDAGGFPDDPIESGRSSLPAHASYEHLGNTVTWRLKNATDWVDKVIDLQVRDIAGHLIDVRFILVPATDDPTVAAVVASYGDLEQNKEGAYLSREDSLRIKFDNDAEDVVAVRVETLRGSDIIATSRQPLTDAGGEASIKLPGPGDYVVRLTTEKGASGLRDAPFNELRIGIDSSSPVIGIERRGSPVGSNVAAESLEGFVARVTDDSGQLGAVDYAVTPAGGTAAYRTFPLGTGDGGAYAIPKVDGEGRFTVSVRARDAAGNLAVVSTEVEVKPAAPPPPVVNAKTIKRDFGIDLVEIPGTARRPKIWISRTELTVDQLQRIWNKTDVDELLDQLSRQSGFGGALRALTRTELETIIEYNSKGRKAPFPAGYITEGAALFFAAAAGGRLPTEDEWKGVAGHYVKPNARYIVVRKGGELSDDERSIRRPPYGHYNTRRAVEATKASAGNEYGLLGLAGNVSEWVTRGRKPSGVMGGSYSEKASSGSLASRPRKPSGKGSSIPQVGLRIVWSGE